MRAGIGPVAQQAQETPLPDYRGEARLRPVRGTGQRLAIKGWAEPKGCSPSSFPGGGRGPVAPRQYWIPVFAGKRECTYRTSLSLFESPPSASRSSLVSPNRMASQVVAAHSRVTEAKRTGPPL